MALQLEGRPARFPRRQVLAILAILLSLAVIWRTAGPAWSSLHVASTYPTLLSNTVWAQLDGKQLTTVGETRQDWEGGGATQLALEGIPPQQRPEYPSGAAVIVETRTTAPNLIPLMLHFSSVLGPNWPVVLFTPEGT
ncbi:hypothetical protein MAPG_09819 [Magnaporthiopsis poae ATCC 64411]|uniref:Uncharacterized protein n=1 Tax=Magnaporthiopsis poae (strain ATCC 64411 / 73-15) TaxID=644358 RepID=A0A0C4EAY2_MAGP6|nr:hypothetical protein MAPG_09819 [Magnaporthiopsis poae ATCC 64411]